MFYFLLFINFINVILTLDDQKLCDYGHIRQHDASCVPCSSVCTTWNGLNDEEKNSCLPYCPKSSLDVTTAISTLSKTTEVIATTSMNYIYILIPIIIIIVVIILFCCRKKIAKMIRRSRLESTDAHPDRETSPEGMNLMDTGSTDAHPDRETSPEGMNLITIVPMDTENTTNQPMPEQRSDAKRSDDNPQTSLGLQPKPSLKFEPFNKDETVCPNFDGILDLSDEIDHSNFDFPPCRNDKFEDKDDKYCRDYGEPNQMNSIAPSKIPSNFGINDLDVKNIQFCKEPETEDDDDPCNSDNMFNSIAPRAISTESSDLRYNKELISLASLNTSNSSRPKVLSRISSKCSDTKIMPSIMENIELEKDSLPSVSLPSNQEQSEESSEKVQLVEEGAADLGQLDSLNDDEEKYYSMAQC